MNENIYQNVNRLINVIIRVLGIITFLGCIVVWAATEKHVFEPYVAGGALAMMGVSAVAGAWMDLRAAKGPPAPEQIIQSVGTPVIPPTTAVAPTPPEVPPPTPPTEPPAAPGP